MVWKHCIGFNDISRFLIFARIVYHGHAFVYIYVLNIRWSYAYGIGYQMTFFLLLFLSFIFSSREISYSWKTAIPHPPNPFPLLTQLWLTNQNHIHIGVMAVKSLPFKFSHVCFNFTGLLHPLLWRTSRMFYEANIWVRYLQANEVNNMHNT